MSDSGTTTTVTPLFSNVLYDRLKYVALVLLPAFSALYFGLGQIWGLPKIEEVIGTVAVLDTVLGMLLRQSNQNYKNSDARFDGELVVTEQNGNVTTSLTVDGDPDEVLQENEEFTLKVEQENVVAVEEVVETPKPRKRPPRKKV